MYKLLVGAGVIAVIIFIMAATGTYMNTHLATDISDNIDTSTDMGYRANQTMLNRSEDYDSDVDNLAMAAYVMVITIPLAAIAVLIKVFH